MAHFKIIHTEGLARAGVFSYRDKYLHTPAFMPVGTLGSVKGLDVCKLENMGAEIMLVNTYHLWQRPGNSLIKEFGGIHRFIGWNGMILSDSGGFQVYSLSSLNSISDQGITFRSHLNGDKLFLTPQLCIDIQNDLGVDIAMVLDECPPANSDYSILESAVKRTIKWAEQCKHRNQQYTNRPCLFGITQGGGNIKLREECLERLINIGFDGYAIGGLSVGEPKEVMYTVLEQHANQLPADKIRYLMGVGTPQDILTAVFLGVDIFDCVMPTRSGRFGRAFVNTPEVVINIKNAKHKHDPQPLDPSCSCTACTRYSRAFLHHLFKTGELLGPVLLSEHNLLHYLSLMKEIRDAILTGSLAELKRTIDHRWQNVKIGMHRDNNAD